MKNQEHVNQNKKHPQNEISWEDAAPYLKEGRILVYPTDTLWGLGCRADKPDICSRCLGLKGSDRSHIASVILTPEMFPDWVFCPPEWKRLLPGPYTLVLPVKKRLLSHLCSGDVDSIAAETSTKDQPIPSKAFLGCRIPDHPALINMVRQLGVPLVTTSLNKTGEAPVTCLEDARAHADLWKLGIVPEEKELAGASTVLKWDGGEWTLLRQGLGPVPSWIKL